MGAITTIVDYIVSPSFLLGRKVLLVLFILLASFSFAAIFNVLMRKKFERMMQKRDEPGHKPDTTKFIVLRRVVSMLIYMLGFALIVFVIPEFRAVSYSILAGAGVVALVAGFAAQSAFANIMSGIFLAVSEPLRVGDKVKIGDNQGTVEDITLRHVMMKSWDNQHIIIPNKVVNDSHIINFSIKGEEIVQTLDVGISYDSDIDLARDIMIEEIEKHPDFIVYSSESPLLDPEEKVRVRVTQAGDFAINLRAYFWAKDQWKGFRMMCDVLEIVKKRYDKEGVEIPFPYRTLVEKKRLPKPKHPKRKKK